MRIISGRAGGRRLKSSKKSNARPTLDRVKEAVFSMLAPYLVDAEVLDLFAGFGGLGLEAVSRGAARAVLVEKNRRNLGIIRKNIDLCGFLDNVELIQNDVFDFLSNRSDSYDIIIMDPPYRKKYGGKIVEIIENNCLLKDGGLIVIEHSNKEEFSDTQYSNIIKEKEYGDTAITIFQFREEI